METWVDVLDFIPIVGSSKSTVEEVVALCQGRQLARERTAAEDDAKMGLELDAASGGPNLFSGTALAKSTGKGAVIVSPEELQRMLAQAATANEDSCVAANSQRRANKLEVGGDHSDGGAAPGREAGKILILSKRGEHVINNNVLKLFKNIIDGFLSGQGKTMQGIRNAGLPKNSAVNKAYDTPMTDEDADFIGFKAVAQVDESYVDANAVKYGDAVRELNSYCITYMNDILASKNGGESGPMVHMEKLLNQVVTDINNRSLYVDQAALTIWLASLKPKDRVAQEQKYNEVKKRVADMFGLLAYRGEKGNDDVIQWVNELNPYLR